MDIQILTANVDELQDLSLYLRLYESVPRERRGKADRMIFQKDNRLSLGAGALLEAALSGLGIHDFALSYAVCSIDKAVRDSEGILAKPLHWVLETLERGQGRQ